LFRAGAKTTRDNAAYYVAEQAGRAGELLHDSIALGQYLFNERDEGARLRAYPSPSREDRPQLYRRQGPVLQHPADQSALEFPIEHPLGRDRQAKTSEHCLTYALRCRDAHAAVHRHARFGAPFPESPRRSSAALVIHDGFMCNQVRGDLRLAMPTD
jgi:hypothetical protein